MPRKSTTPPDPETEKLKSTLFTRANTILRGEHREEFDAIITALYAEHGLTWSRRLTPTERAARDIEALLAEHPELRSQYGLSQEDDVTAG